MTVFDVQEERQLNFALASTAIAGQALDHFALSQLAGNTGAKEPTVVQPVGSGPTSCRMVTEGNVLLKGNINDAVRAGDVAGTQAHLVRRAIELDTRQVSRIASP